MSDRGYTIWGVVGRAYGFTFGNLGRLALIALPMFLVLSAITFVMTFTAPAVTSYLISDIPQAGALLQIHSFVYGALAAIPGLILVTGLYRAYFNRDARMPYLWSGWLPLRTVGTEIVYYFFFAIAALLVLMVGTLIFTGLELLGQQLFGSGVDEVRSLAAPQPYLGIAGIILIAFGIAAFLYLGRFILRYSLFLPHTVNENKIRPREAWRITRGHLRPLLMIYILGFVSFSIIIAILLFAIKAGFSLAGAESMVWLLSLADGEAPAASPDREWVPVLGAALIIQAVAVFSTMFSVGLLGAAYDAVMGRFQALNFRPGT